MVLNLI